METKSYSDFWQRTHKSAREKGFPLRVMFELTYRCNFKCKHCYVPESYKKKAKQELKTKGIFSTLDQLADIGCLYLGFTGGEPFLRKDIFDILWHAKRRGFQIIIYTNGSLIDKDKAQELKRLNPNKIDITIPAMNESVFERITGITGSHDIVYRAIKLLHKKGVKLGFKSCVLNENKNEIKDIQDFAASLGALHRLDDRLSPRLDGDREPYRYRGFRKQIVSRSPGHQVSGKDRFEDCALSVQRTKHEPRTTPACSAGRNHEPLFRCGVGVSHMAINPFGELKMCLLIDYPKYKILNKQVSGIRYQVSGQENGLRDAWERLKELVAAIKPDKNYQCGKCSLYSYCKWCPAKSWLYNRSFTSCEPENQHWAELKKRYYGTKG